MRPHTLSEAFERLIHGPRSAHAIDEFLDFFYGLRSAGERLASLAAEPPGTGDPVEDATAAAIAEYLCNQYGLTPAPDWVFDPSRTLSVPFFFGTIDAPEWRAWMVHSSPSEYRSRNLFTEERPLRRARQAAVDLTFKPSAQKLAAPF